MEGPLFELATDSVLQVFILSGLRLEDAAAEGPQTSLQAKPYQQTNQFLRFGIGVGLLLAIGLGQAGSCTCMQLCIRLLCTGLLLGRHAPALACSCASGCSPTQAAVHEAAVTYWSEVAGCKMLCAVLCMCLAVHNQQAEHLIL